MYLTLYSSPVISFFIDQGIKLHTVMPLRLSVECDIKNVSKMCELILTSKALSQK
jgi:hypothetical protein